jgi:hypothetical protein
MKLNGIVSTVIAAGLLIGSAGLAVAGSSGGDNSADNPFSLYREAHDPANTGTAITAAPVTASSDSYRMVVAGPASAAFGGLRIQSAVPADNPFALYRERGQPSNVGSAVAASHIATAADNALSQVASDPFN